jgi:hypothetical protein
MLKQTLLATAASAVVLAGAAFTLATAAQAAESIQIQGETVSLPDPGKSKIVRVKGEDYRILYKPKQESLSIKQKADDGNSAVVTSEGSYDVVKIKQKAETGTNSATTNGASEVYIDQKGPTNVAEVNQTGSTNIAEVTQTSTVAKPPEPKKYEMKTEHKPYEPKKHDAKDDGDDKKKYEDKYKRNKDDDRKDHGKKWGKPNWVEAKQKGDHKGWVKQNGNGNGVKIAQHN